MKRLLLIRYGEIALKGLNRNYFVDTLADNIRNALREYPGLRTEKIQGRIALWGVDDENESEVIEKLRKIFGISKITRAVETQSDIEAIKEASLQVIEDLEGKTFKVESRRGDKSFPLKSPEISSAVGEYILRNTDRFKVDVHDPDILLGVEVRPKSYITFSDIPGEKGMPLGTGGKGGIMISGGIDSPVAAYLMARRGMKMTGIHFHSYPFTSLDAQKKVERLGGKLAEYNNGFDIAMISLTDIQQQIISKCDDRYLTVILRRFMIKCAERFARENGIQMLVTGESLGQVASQTTDSIICTDAAANMPILRPLIAMDKDEIISIAQKIDTYTISIEPYEDCCTVFVPKHPQTHPVLEKVLAQEQRLECEKLIDEAMDSVKLIRTL
ncbi:MAG: tRNA 4-thiouridine(8) synthase ThiI [Eubacteriaceae bacterium]|nr:tRNA 4-thiouridine(8) synthase ThiI [Eubacteriaceae bacterium]